MDNLPHTPASLQADPARPGLIIPLILVLLLGCVGIIAITIFLNLI